VAVGVSFDTVEEQKTFADAESFGYALLSDPDRVMGAAYQAERPAGTPFSDYPQRITYLIAPDGTIAKTYDLSESKTLDQHADDLLADIAALS